MMAAGAVLRRMRGMPILHSRVLPRRPGGRARGRTPLNAALASADDRSLIRALASGRPEALAELYDRHGRYVLGLAARIVGDPQAAEEVVQDVFTKLWKKASAYDASQAGVATWIMRITRNRAIDELRRRGARPLSHGLGDESPLPDTTAPGPEELAEASLRRGRVRAAMAQLPAAQRRAVELAFFGGRTHNEIASELDQPLGTVKTRIRAAMQTLRRLLAEEKPG
jgi:RNA polymerase sigma-70 factor (ECF subfamily)